MRRKLHFLKDFSRPWSAVTRHRFPHFADLSANPSRVLRLATTSKSAEASRRQTKVSKGESVLSVTN
jgi:hypothetical protein